MAAPRGNRYAAGDRRLLTPMQRFLSFCRFEPETGCVVWTGGQTSGRGHHVPYGAFWFEGRRWFAHRWSALHIKGLVIDGFDVDHCCPGIPRPNTLCVEHVQALTPARNRELQTQRTMIHLQVGLLNYDDVYGPEPDTAEITDVPFYSPPAWLGTTNAQRPDHRPRDVADADCPF